MAADIFSQLSIDVQAHLTTLGATSELLVTQWLMAAFAADFPLHFVGAPPGARLRMVADPCSIDRTHWSDVFA